jgi:uncharacterized protein YhaN
MRDWVGAKDALVRRLESTRGQEAEARRLGEAISARRSALDDALLELGEPGAGEGEDLDALVDRAAGVVDRLQSARGERQSLERRLRDGVRRIDEAATAKEMASADLDRWTTEYEKEVAVLGLGADSLPREALAVAEKIDELTTRLDDLRKLEQRVGAMAADAASFEADVRTLVDVAAPDLGGLSAEAAVARLYDLLTEATGTSAEKKNLAEQIEALDNEGDEAAQAAHLLDLRLAELCREAGCEGPDELPECERRSAELVQTLAALRGVEEQLVTLSGMELERLVNEAEGAEAAELELEIAELGRRIGEIESERTDLDRTIGSERQILAAMDGGDSAAVHAELAEAVRAEVDRLVSRYQRLRLASAVLRAEVERYRAENQAPLLRRASELFNRLTLGSFSGLETAYDEKDRPVLEGTRESGGRVVVEGMSDGTRDQLFLALRLATLEKYLASGEPLPFVVDDVLIGFDDERAKAALTVLAELSAKTQVLVFTHHRRLTELAAEVAPGVLVLHELTSQPSAAT